MNLRFDKIACGVFILVTVLANHIHVSGGAVVVVPQGIESVNRSDVNMGCTISALVESGGVMVCSCGSIILDGISPTINTSTNTSDWASQLVTVRKNKQTTEIPYDYVLLTFGFDTAVSLTGIELDMFICPEWNIDAPVITVFADVENNLVFNGGSGLQFENYTPSQSSCNSLSTVTISLGGILTGRTWHIVAQGFPEFSPIEWVHVGEVRFLGADKYNSSSCTQMPSTTVTPTSDSDTNTMTSSPPPPPSPSASSSDGSSPVVFIAIGVVVAILVLGLLVLVVIIIILRKKRHSSQEELKQFQDRMYEPGDVELKSKTVEQDEYRADNPLYAQGVQGSAASNGHQAAATACPLYDTAGGDVNNPHYYTTPDKPGTVPVDDGFYSVVDSEKRATLTTARDTTQNTAPKESAPVYSTVDKDGRKKKPPELVTEAVYSSVHKEPSPAVPPKSPDLQTYLSTKEAVGVPAKEAMTVPAIEISSSKPSKVSTLPVTLATGMSDNPNYESADALSNYSNEADSAMYAQPYFHTAHTVSTHDSNAIYSEPLQPSDFTHVSTQPPEQMGEEDVRMYSSVYTLAATGDDTFHQTVEITSENITELKELGTGNFGQVVLAQTNNLSLKDMRMSNWDENRNISVFVAVKKLRSNATSTQREAFDKEIKFMYRLKHPNVVLFLGVCYREPAFIMMEYMEKGDLSQFLQQYSEIVPTPSDDTQIGTSTVVRMATQIASGMMYLASKNFVHRDLASRNCLVGEDFTVKLADFGMSRNLYESHYYRIHGNAILPIRWMSTECFYGMFSEKTDVWAFGITVWELFTLSKDKPYPDLSDAQVVEDAVNRGTRRKLHPRPDACPQSVYEVMLQCWTLNPKERAAFKDLHEMLQKLPQDF